MLDRVREAIFSTLAPWLDGAVVLDLFAGSGAMSIEALSRGARRARLVEADARVRDLEAQNLAALGLTERATVVGGDAAATEAWMDGPFDVVFCDPPFPWLADPDRRPRVLDMVRELVAKHLADEGVVVLHVPAGAVTETELTAAHLVGERASIGSSAADQAVLPAIVAQERVYGGQSIWYLQLDPE
jgi:16S rRNA (guanine966-N2)-methyltransferase